MGGDPCRSFSSNCQALRETMIEIIADASDAVMEKFIAGRSAEISEGRDI